MIVEHADEVVGEGFHLRVGFVGQDLVSLSREFANLLPAVVAELQKVALQRLFFHARPAAEEPHVGLLLKHGSHARVREVRVLVLLHKSLLQTLRRAVVDFFASSEPLLLLLQHSFLNGLGYRLDVRALLTLDQGSHMGQLLRRS